MYGSVLDYLTPIAESIGLVDGTKAHPRTDVRLAATALSLAAHTQPIAFASSDRKLNDLVKTIYDDVCARRREKFPVLLKTLNVYSFLQGSGIFVPFEDEKNQMQESER